MDTVFGSCNGQMSVRARKALFEGSSTEEQNTPSTRKPLSFLSPNNFMKRSSTKPAKDDTTDGDETTVEQLKHQINSIQRRIKCLDEKSNGSDLKDIVFNQAQSKQQQEQLQELNRKLIHIQSGLRDIEGERCALVSKSKQLEEEKRRLYSQLRNREQEIEVLQKRCLDESEKLKEIGTLRAMNADLNRKMRQIEFSLQTKDDHDAEKRDLLNQFSASQETNNNLVQRLKSVQKDHDAVCNDLAKSLKNVQKLVEEKQTWEAEKRRLQQRTDLKFDQQRLANLNSTIELREQLSAHELRAQEQERVVLEQSSIIEQLRNEVAKLKANQTNTTQAISDDYQQKLHELRQSYETKLSSIQVQHDIKIKTLTHKLDSRDSEVETLRKDMATQMQELMLATSDLQKLQDDNKTLDAVLEDVEVLEHDRATLQDRLHEKDTEIAELSAEILKLEIEKELAVSDSERLKATSDTVKAELSKKENAIQSLESTVSMLTVELDNIKSRSEQLAQAQADSSEITGLKTTIAHLQREIEKFQAVHEAKDAEMSSLEAALHEHANRLAKVINENAELQVKVRRADTEYGSMEEQSSLLQVRLLDKEDEIKRLQQQWKKQEDEYLDKINKEALRREVCENDLFVLRNKLDRTSTNNRDLAELEKENDELKDKVRRQESYLKRKLEQQKALRGRSTGILSASTERTNKPWASKPVSGQATATTAADDSLEWESLDGLLGE